MRAPPLQGCISMHTAEFAKLSPYVLSPEDPWGFSIWHKIASLRQNQLRSLKLACQTFSSGLGFEGSNGHETLMHQRTAPYCMIDAVLRWDYLLVHDTDRHALQAASTTTSKWNLKIDCAIPKSSLDLAKTTVKTYHQAAGILSTS